MKSIIMTVVFLFSLVGLLPEAFSQQTVIASSDFEDGTLQGWTVEYTILNVTAGGPAGSTMFLRCEDEGVPEVSRLLAPPEFHGDWTGAVFCYDYRMIDVSGVDSLRPYFVIRNGDLAARFEWPAAISQSSGWQHVCAAVRAIAPGDPLPDGWTMGSGTPIEKWNELIAGVNVIAFTIDIQGAVFSEVLGFDNFMLTKGTSGIFDRDEAEIPADAEFLDCHPNPAIDFTMVNYKLYKPFPARLELIDNSGRSLMVLTDDGRDAGLRSARFETENIPTGTYWVQLRAGTSILTKPLTVIR